MICKFFWICVLLKTWTFQKSANRSALIDSDSDDGSDKPENRLNQSHAHANINEELVDEDEGQALGDGAKDSVRHQPSDDCGPSTGKHISFSCTNGNLNHSWRFVYANVACILANWTLIQSIDNMVNLVVFCALHAI